MERIVLGTLTLMACPDAFFVSLGGVVSRVSNSFTDVDPPGDPSSFDGRVALLVCLDVPAFDITAGRGHLYIFRTAKIPHLVDNEEISGREP
jgi:hypothetical protein